MLTLDVESIKDYRVCELFYKYKYQDKEPEKVLAREAIADRFEISLKRVASFFFYKKQGGIIPSYNALLNRWEKIWFPKGTSSYNLTTEQHEISHGNLSSYTKIATASLLQFYDDFGDHPGEPVLIDEKFLIPIGKDLRLEGRIDLVLRTDNLYSVVKWTGRKRRPLVSSLTFDFAALRLAFEYRNEMVRSANYMLYDMGSSQPGEVTVNTSEESIDTMLYWANSISEAEMFIPRRGFTTRCRGCPFDKSCEAFKFPKRNYGG